MPCAMRLTSSSVTFGAKPAIREPTTNRLNDTWISSFLLHRSAILPQSGTVAVIASSSVVTTQV